MHVKRQCLALRQHYKAGLPSSLFNFADFRVSYEAIVASQLIALFVYQFLSAVCDMASL